MSEEISNLAQQGQMSGGNNPEGQNQKVYKYEYDQVSDNWNMTEGRWGGEREEKLFNRFDPNPDNYYLAADNYQQAETFMREIPALQRIMHHSRFSKQWDRDEMLVEQQLESVNVVKEIRHELYQDLQTTEQEYYNGNGSTTADNNHKKAVFQELYHDNDFATPERTQQFIAEVRQGEHNDQFRETTFDNAHPADIAQAAFKLDLAQQQQRGFVTSNTNSNDLEQYAERESRVQILAQEHQANFIEPTNQPEAIEQAQEMRRYFQQQQREPEFSTTSPSNSTVEENQWANTRANNPFEQNRNTPFATGAAAEWER